ncbi:MAG: polyprenyl synthetase family protein, partial [Candidatus Omnitrophota bacterium]
TQEDIYKIYDYKTANYTFASPLTMGATLAGAKPRQIKKLYSYGMLLGRAFQIKDDISGTFGAVKKTGKSNLTDIQEAKRTLLVWHAYNHAQKKDRLMIKKIMQNKVTKDAELIKMRQIIINTGSLAYAQEQIKCLCLQALKQLQGLTMNQKYKQTLDNFSRQIFKF